MVVHAYYPLAETRVQREAETLVRAGYQVDVICLRGEGERARERHGGVEIYRLPVRLNKKSLAHQLVAYIKFLTLATVEVSRLQLRHRYSSVQVHNLPDFLVFCSILPKVQGVPVILDLHDLMPEFVAGRFGTHGPPLLDRLVRFQERAACRFADHVITVSDHWREKLIRRGVADNKCTVVMNLADEKIFSPGHVRRPGGDGFRLLYHGTVTHRYGLDLALRAVRRLKDEIPEIRLLIIGRGDAMADLHALRDDLNLRDCVELRNEFVPSEQLPEVIATANVGIVPYRNDPFTDELLPTKLMEYAAVGLPCVASRTTAMERYFSGAMVEFFEPGSVEDLARRVHELYRNRERLHTLARRSSVFNERYNWDTVGAKYVALVDRLGTRSTPRLLARAVW
jgi:glycosyltransferase involved in cell wall biosynthesis